MSIQATRSLHSADGSTVPLLIDRWTAPPSGIELDVLDRAVGPVLDVGCGPGRHVSELAARGVPALGIDLSGEATQIARERGASVLQRSVFDPLPHEGDWGTALLIDGNIGIGGDAVALLRRLRELVMRTGSILAEVEPPGAATRCEVMRVVCGDVSGPWFPWARVSIDGIDALADEARLSRTWTGTDGERWFVELTA